jgi:hypothetical protein
MLRPGPIGDHVGAGPTQVPDGFFLDGGDPDRDQLPGSVQPRQPAAAPPVGLDLVDRAMGLSDGAITWQRTPMLCSRWASS